MPEIRIACSTGFTLPLSDIQEIQGELKSLSKIDFEKLKKEILTTGFAFAPHVWKNQEDGKHYITDGHQRLRVVRHLVEKEEYTCPEIPVSFVEAKDIQEAKRRVLQATSAYGKMTEESLHEFIETAQFDFLDIKESFDLPSIDFDHFEENFYKDPSNGDEDEVPPVPKEPKSKLGDLYLLDPFYECETCKKIYPYEVGKTMQSCPCS